MKIDIEMQKTAARLTLAALLLALGACAADGMAPPENSTLSDGGAASNGKTPSFGQAQPAAASADAGEGLRETAGMNTAGQPNGGTTEIFPGTGSFVGSVHGKKTATATVTDSGDITLNFVNADVRDVVKAVLGDYLKLNYVIGSNLQGTVTIQTSEPLGRAEVLPVLEQALRMSGLALVKLGESYKVMSLDDAPKVSGATPLSAARGSSQPGFGVEIVPLKYIGASEMQNLLQPIVPAQGILHVDTDRNLLMISGTEQERETMLENIALFDVDWLSGMSFALYTPQYTDAQELSKELEEILGGHNSPIAGFVRLIPITRLNAILAISPQVRYLNQLQSWFKRLDRPGEGSDRRLFVYHVQNGRASDLAATLTKVLTGHGSGAASPSATQSAYGGDAYGGARTMNGLPAQGQTGPGGGLLPPAAAGGDASYGGDEDSGASSMGDINITADETNNALVVLASPQEFNFIESALHQLDTVPLQVLLEAAIAEVTLTNDLKYGVQYAYQPNDHHQLVLSDSKTSTIAASFPGLSYIFTDGDNIKVILDALSSITHVDVVSSPEVLVLNNQTATLQVGDQVPVATEQAVSTTSSGAPLVNSIEYHDTGVILKVTPRVNQGGLVMMDISQEVSDVAQTDTSTIDSPTIQQRKINSTVAVHNNETIALGGLIKDSQTNGKSGVPFLQDIPVVGNLFRDTQNSHTKTELMVLITPHVVDNLQKARDVTDELRSKLPAVQELLDKSHRT